jgi:hypothetical protein
MEHLLPPILRHVQPVTIKLAVGMELA